jgi:hypothetical protein
MVTHQAASAGVPLPCVELEREDRARTAHPHNHRSGARGLLGIGR